MKIKEKLKIWKKIFGSWKYSSLALVVAILFYSFNVLVNNWGSIFGFYSNNGFIQAVNFFSILSLGFYNTIKFHSFVSLIIVSVLLGALFSIVTYKTIAGSELQSKRFGIIGSVGIFLAALAPGCAACGVGLFSVLGISAATLSIFPYEGLELSIFAIFLLTFSIGKITKSMNGCNACQIKLNNNNERR